MMKEVEKTAWQYQVIRTWRHGGYWEREYRPGYYTDKKQAIKALGYFGSGFIEASRHLITRPAYGRGTGSRREAKIVYELNQA